MFRTAVSRHVLLAYVAHYLAVAALDEHRHRLAQTPVLYLGYHERTSGVRLEQPLHLLNLHLYPSAAHHVVLASYDAEASAVGVELGYVVCLQPLRAHGGSVYHEASVGTSAHAHVVERSVPQACLRSVEPSQGYVRQCLCHAVGAPHGVGEVFQ